MDDRPLPHDVARALIQQYGGSALDVARSRAAAAEKAGSMKDHDHAMMVLTEIEEMLMESEIDVPKDAAAKAQAGHAAIHGKTIILP